MREGDERKREKKKEKSDKSQIFTDKSTLIFHVNSFRAEKIEKEPSSAALDTLFISLTVAFLFMLVDL